VRYLDSRIALLIQNRMAADEQQQVAEHLDEEVAPDGVYLDDKKMAAYGNLFFLLQAEPRHIASLCRLISMAEIDILLQTVMFTLYGNQYEGREEHLLLTMFQVRSAPGDSNVTAPLLTPAFARALGSRSFPPNSRRRPSLAPSSAPIRPFRG
jgi:hypothetical protein